MEVAAGIPAAHVSVWAHLRSLYDRLQKVSEHGSSG